MIGKLISNAAKYFPVFVLIFLLAYSGCQKNGPVNLPATCLEKFNLPYGTDSLQRYDLFLPQGRDQNTKMIIIIHGGGWVSGEKEYIDYYAWKFSEFGFAAVCMNYRLANSSVHYQEMLDDIAAMITCVSKNSTQWGIGTGKIALFGYSAGGHLALLYSYSRDKGRKVGSVVSLAGPTDIQDSLLWESPGFFEEIGLMAGNTSPVTWDLANPVHFIGATNPATMLIHGTNDSVVPVSQSLKLRSLLTLSRAPVKLLLLENETHYYSTEATKIFLDESRHFLDANMKKPNEKKSIYRL
jgi:acetyl esterase/lipase